ncbi:PilZ domain-containing protein [Aquibacillus rhizosphaerae]|uniref:PilZ domain-containing protein n=1 Tax=Aquibacillus rhizosphaerae TaxID=3051431 RepID=A0ABT7KZM3_9BACI|nr:PilZ domain-containing protein [Aquibacillus sp. LR5S19]MDL4838907.1 PilZ domain-containing protein [Aquibacillus sp. LR5S19]
MKRSTQRIEFTNPPLADTTIMLVEEKDEVQITKILSKIKFVDLSVTGLCFSSELDLYKGQKIIIRAKLFSPTNHIFGEIKWKEQNSHEMTYGLEIISADFNYFQYMNSYENYIQNKNNELLVGGRQ